MQINYKNENGDDVSFHVTDDRDIANRKEALWDDYLRADIHPNHIEELRNRVQHVAGKYSENCSLIENQLTNFFLDHEVMVGGEKMLNINGRMLNINGLSFSGLTAFLSREFHFAVEEPGIPELMGIIEGLYYSMEHQE